ncbi:class A beta-lactamase-related serine hydrolase [Deinococcus cavernae]|uniref:Class A beta-lactamase-related serine hydrolase n=1 Tax=Deinococcus cavernae TaxID=2320857 RepID=A0A418V4W1_9DEIO|nr:serine hydrolase domain-containing protein [Deinococcus cavernae]RJF71144.1 class A beta-lactamase-related serine hydrolase [Deinococcus cavernae]
MFRRDPLRQTLSQVGDALGCDVTASVPLARQALAHGGVVGVAHGGRAQVWAFGDVPSTGVFELASITKSFTAALAQVLVAQGVLTWDTPVRSLGREFRGLPLHFTPLTLATHTAGLPIHPARAVITGVTHFHDPYGSMSARDVLASARRWARPSRPPRFGYSNLGAGVLALALARAAGHDMTAQGFGQALKTSVLEPLQLASITLRPHPARLVTPRAALGGTSTTNFGLLVGAGGLYGAADDLLTFAQAHLSGQAGRHWEAAQVVKGLSPPHAAVAPGWFHTPAPGSPLVWHDGVARGTRAALGFHPATGRVVVVLARGGLPILGARAAVPLLMLRLLDANVGRDQHQ